MQKYFKVGRILLALVFSISLLVAFADVKGNLNSDFYKTVFYLQFLPSLLSFFTPGTILSIGFIVVIILTIIAGRVYCSTICPLGVLQDLFVFIKRKIKPRNRLRFKKAYSITRYSFLSVSVLSILLGIIFSFNKLFALNILDPYSNFGRISTHIFQPVIIFLNNIVSKIIPAVGLNTLESSPFNILSFVVGFSVLLLVGIMSFFSGRLYCNTVCPVGTFLGLLSRISIFKIKINKLSCTKCGSCQQVCKANCINIKTLEIDESRCINCYNCIPVCNESAIGYLKKESTKYKTVESTDSGRRLLMVSLIGYLATKTLNVKADGRHNQDKSDDSDYFYSRGAVTPPGSESKEHLLSKCVTCHLCVSVCPTKVLQPGFLDYGFFGIMVPKMDYSKHFCNYECTKCGEVCPSGAIMPLLPEQKKLTQIGKVQFKSDICIVKTEGTACGSCSEHCPTQAVRMVPYENGLTIPETNNEICIGCGACEYACPVEKPHKAIFIAANPVHLFAEKPKTDKIEYKETEDFPF